MNILTDVLPDIVEVNGTDFEINTDFWIVVIVI